MSNTINDTNVENILRWSEIQPEFDVNGEATGNDLCDVTLESRAKGSDFEDDWTEIGSDTLIIHSQSEAENEMAWRNVEDRLLASHGLDRSKVTEVVTPW